MPCFSLRLISGKMMKIIVRCFDCKTKKFYEMDTSKKLDISSPPKVFMEFTMEQNKHTNHKAFSLVWESKSAEDDERIVNDISSWKQEKSKAG